MYKGTCLLEILHKTERKHRAYGSRKAEV